MAYQQYRSVPLRDLMDTDPVVAHSIIRRHAGDFSNAALRDKHVVFVTDVPTSHQHPNEYREVTMALLFDRPTTLEPAAIATAIKSPEDAPDPRRGMLISLSRVVTRLNEGRHITRGWF